MSARSPALPASAILALAPAMVLALAAGCAPEVPADGSAAGGVSVTVVSRQQWGVPDRPARRYGPGVEAHLGQCMYFGRSGSFLFELANRGTEEVKWVVWHHRYSYSVSTQSPFDGMFRSEQCRDLVRCAWLGGLRPGGAAMCRVDTDADGPGVFVMGEGEVAGSLAGSRGRPPRAHFVAERYAGPEWLAPRGKFVRERLDAALDRLRAAGAGAAETDLLTLVEASRLTNSGVPVVKKPEIVACFVERALAAAPGPAPGGERRPLDARVRAFVVPVLLDLVPPAELRGHADALGALAAHAAELRVFELLLKAGSAKALAALAADPARLPEEGREDLVLAARAASGEGQAFAALLAGFAAAKESGRKIALGRLLALVGRKEGLEALAGALRWEPAGSEDQVLRAYVRGELVTVLRLALPEEAALYVSRSPAGEELAAAERFCAARFGAKYDGEPAPVPRRGG